MWTKGQKTLVGVFALVAVVSLAFGYWVSTKAAGFAPPPPTPLAVWLPANAEIRTTNAVRPGTFSVTLPLEEFKKRFPTGGLVSYPPKTGTGPAGSSEPITIWHAEPGSAVFYETVQQIPYPEWPLLFRIGTLRLEDGSIVAYPENFLDSVTRGAYSLAVGGAGIALFAVVVFSFGRRPQ